MYLLIINIIIYILYFFENMHTHCKNTWHRHLLNLLYILYIYCNFKKLCFIVLPCRFFSYLCIEKVSRSISKNTKVTSNKPKNSQKSNTMTPKMQHLTLIFDQKMCFFVQKMPKNRLSFFELRESVSKSHPLVCQKHPLSVQKMIYRCSKMPSQCIKKHLIFAPSVLTNMLSMVNLQYSI